MTDRDELLEQLAIARAYNGRGSPRQRRALYRFCIRSFRDWHGVEFVSELSIAPARRLSQREMVQWLRLAEDMPAVARDVLKLQRSAMGSGQRLSLREMRWSTERRRQLIELHRLALLAASRQAQQSTQSLEDVLQTGQASEASLKQRRRMVTAAENITRQLSEQLQALQNVESVKERTL